MDMDRVRQIIEHGPHRQRMRKLAGQFCDLVPDGLDAEHPLIGLLRDDADETAIAAGFEPHRAAARAKRDRRPIVTRILSASTAIFLPSEVSTASFPLLSSPSRRALR